MMQQLETRLVQLTHEVEEGNRSAIKAWVEMKRMLDLVKTAMSAIEDAAIDERELVGADECHVDGLNIELVQGRKIYSYKHIDRWKELQVHMKQVEQAAKTAADTGNMVVDPYGQEIEPAQLSFGKSYLKATRLR